jgi:thiol-disulfide isomerase/thioredoxin
MNHFFTRFQVLLCGLTLAIGCEQAKDPGGEQPEANTPAEPTAEEVRVERNLFDMQLLARRPGDGRALIELCESLYNDPNAELQAAARSTMVKYYATQLIQGGRQANVPLGEAVRMLFANDSTTPKQLGTAAGWVERADQIELAREMWARIDERFADSSDREVAEETRDLVERSKLRLNMLGSELNLAGSLAHGGELDWSAYRGKVVLVDFWATWCSPCLAEMPHIKRIYDRYHARGFDLVGISLDGDREGETADEIVRLFLDDRDYPWKSVVFHKPAEQNMDNPLAKKYGIGGIPRGILVGRDGRVISINASGARLDKLMREQFPYEQPKKNSE